MLKKNFLKMILILMILNINFAEGAPIDKNESWTTLKVGYIEETGFVVEDWSGHFSGYGYEYMESLSNYGHWKFEYIPFRNWLKMGEALENGEIDMMPTMPGDYKIFPNTTRTDHVIGRFPMELVTNGEIKSEMLIGNLATNYETPALPLIAEEEGFHYEFRIYTDYWQMKESFKRGEIDGYIDAMVGTNTKPFAIFDRQSYRLLVRASDVELLEQLNHSMDQMLLYQPDMRNRLAEKYLEGRGFPLILNRNEREYLNEQKKLKVAVSLNQKPTVYKEDGQFKGAIVEIMQKVAEDLQIEMEFTGTNTPEESAELVRSGKVDLMADALCDYSWADDFEINLTQPYINIGFVAVHRADYDENAKNTVAACENFLYTKSHIDKYFSADKIRYVQNMEDGFKAVNEGRADVIFVAKNQAINYIEDTETYNLIPSSEEYFFDSLCIGVSKNSDPRLWHILNKAINHIDDKFINGAMDRSQRSTIHFTPKWFVYHHPFEVICFIVSVALFIGGVVIYRYHLRREHIKVIQHMAYTDIRYNLPNLIWLESQMPKFLVTTRQKEPTKNIYIAILAIESKSSLVAQYGEELLIKYMQETSKKLEQKDFIAMSAVGIGSSKLILVCKADSDAQISEYMTEILEECCYIETKDSRIKMHMKSGICEYKTTDFSVRQVAEKANFACLEVSIHDVQIFNEKMQEDITLQNQIEGHMEEALKLGEFKAFYQPKYDIKTRKIIGAEALVRWTSAELGFMPPGKFIPLFEKNGFVIPVDYSILEQVFQLQKSRLAAGKEVVPISVNQSRLHMTEEGYIDKIRSIIEKYNLSPTGLIELEVTETVFGDFDQKTNQKRATEIIGQLHEMGFTISVDDFGSGYSSFMMLNYLPMDVMKIDRTLLDASGDSNRMKNILANVINLGRSLNMQVICEGIETLEQEKLLLELGCHYGQGFLNSKPLPLDEFIKFFEKRNSEVA